MNERLQKYLKTKEGKVIMDSKALLCDHGNTAQLKIVYTISHPPLEKRVCQVRPQFVDY